MGQTDMTLTERIRFVQGKIDYYETLFEHIVETEKRVMSEDDIDAAIDEYEAYLFELEHLVAYAENGGSN